MVPDIIVKFAIGYLPVLLEFTDILLYYFSKSDIVLQVIIYFLLAQIICPKSLK